MATGTMADKVKQRKRKLAKKKICRLCQSKAHVIDFKDVNTLRRYQTEEGKILSRRITGNCFNHQKMLKIAIKKARNIQLVP
jgi:small subunit ribosomal protein S18